MRRNEKGHVIPNRRFVRGRRGSVALPLGERFWRMVDKSAGNEGCWLWLGSRNSDGYGRFNLGGHCVGAHRVAYRLAFGCVETARCVCHRCDTPSCVNPTHLFLGSDMDNSRDKVAKRRHRFGERTPGARLTARDVQSIRREVANGCSMRSVALQFAVTPPTVRAIMLGRTWRSVS